LWLFFCQIHRQTHRMSSAQLATIKQKLIYANRKTSYAWAKYYEEVNSHFGDDKDEYEKLEIIVKEDNIPTHIKTQLKEMADKLKHKWDCCVCLDFIETLQITSCGHFMCESCFDSLKDATEGNKWTCPVCRKNFNKQE